jgi:hypothetical protein
VQFDGPGCAPVYWDVAYTRPEDVGFDVDVEVRQRGSNSPTTDGDYVGYYESDLTGNLSGNLCVSDYYFDASKGPLAFSGLLTATLSGGRSAGSVALPSIILPVRQNPSTFSRVRIKSRTPSKFGSIRGRVTAKTLTKGRLGAGGDVEAQVKVRGRWRHVMNLSVDEFGRFASGGEYYTIRPIPKGAKVRLRLTDCGWCTDARAKATAW